MIEDLLSFQEQRAKINFCRRLLLFSLGLILFHEFLKLVSSEIPALMVMVVLLPGVGILLWFLKRERQDLRAASFEMDRRGDHPDLFPTLLELDGRRESAMTSELKKLARREYVNRVNDKDFCTFKAHVWKVLASCLLLVLVVLLPFLPNSSKAQRTGRETPLPLSSSEKEPASSQKSTQEIEGNGSSAGSNKGAESKKSDLGQRDSKSTGKSQSPGLDQEKKDSNQQESGESMNKGTSPGSKPKKTPNQNTGSEQKRFQQQKIKPTEKSLNPQAKESKMSIPRRPPASEKKEETKKKQEQTKNLSSLKSGSSLKPNSKKAKFDPKMAHGGKGGEGKDFDWKRIQPGAVRNQDYREGRDRLEGFLSDPRIPDAYKENVLRMMESVQGKKLND